MLDIKEPYTAYCFDQAVGYLGTYIENELDKVGHKPSSEERTATSARKQALKRLLGADPGKKQYADPAALFN